MSTDNPNDGKATAPKTFMDLPREIYLMVTAYLTPTDLTRLAVVSKDYYLAVQQPLYERIDINSWEKLPRLVRTLTSVPVVSHISAKQRQRWYKLSDAQLRERDITKLKIVLDTTTARRSVSGADFARCIGAISRRSTGVDIELALYGPWDTLLTQLGTSSCTLPDVRRLVLYIGNKQGTSYDQRPPASKLDIWDICFSGSGFPDLLEVEIDTVHASPDQRPTTIKEAASSLHREGYMGYMTRYEGNGAGSTPFYGLKKMTKISLKHNDMLQIKTLDSLFSSNIIPAKLTHLEIVNCPLLQQARNHAELALLLQRGLPLLQHFKLHLQRNPSGGSLYYAEYCSDIVEHPESHLCNVVRELGQKIKSLDLALPYACNRMFLPRTKKPPAVLAERDWPTIPREPYETLPERLLSEGYRYRRLICWDAICGSSHEWNDMMDLVENQGDMISWEIVSYRDKSASWHVSGCLPMSYSASDVVKREIPQ